MKTFALWHSIVVHLISNCCLIVPIVLWLLFSFHQIVVWFHTINANLLSKCCLIVICLSFYCHLLLSIFFFWLSFHSCLTTLLRCTLFTVIYFCCLLHKRANSLQINFDFNWISYQSFSSGADGYWILSKPSQYFKK